MNKAYNYRSKFDSSYESNCKIIKLVEKDSNVSALDSLGSFLSSLTSKNIISVIKAIIAAICFFGFIGVIGGVESETISLGTGIIVSLFLVSVEIVCFYKPRNNN